MVSLYVVLIAEIREDAVCGATTHYARRTRVRLINENEQCTGEVSALIMAMDEMRPCAKLVRM